MSDKKCPNCGACKECGAHPPQVVPMPYPVFRPFPWPAAPFVPYQPTWTMPRITCDSQSSASAHSPAGYTSQLRNSGGVYQ